MGENQNHTAIPKPVFMRLLALFGGGVGCLLVGVIVSSVTADRTLFRMSAVIGIALIVKGFLLRSKINTGLLYNVSGVCVSVTPKVLGRYRCIELVDTATGDEVHFILPKKITFKIGHVYTCYFDTQINNRPEGVSNPQGGFFNADLDLPTNGYLGSEDFGIYQEMPAPATVPAIAGAEKGASASIDTADNNPVFENKEENLP